MAEVFEAERIDRAPTRTRVALKRVLAAHLGDPEFERMFADEINIATRIRAEEVLAVIDACATPPAQYLALELIDGIDGAVLQRASRSGELTLSTSAIAMIGARVARGLHAAHEARDEHGAPMGVVHRDVSPSNIFVASDGTVKLGDFGVAFARERTAKTVTGVVKGKIAFMAPEQLSGLAFDRRADLFALACALHAIAVGDSPVRSMEDLVRVLRDGAVTLDDALPDALRPVLSRALCSEPSGRFDSALAFADALTGLCADELGARQELAALSSTLSTQSAIRPRFDALWSLDAMGLDEPGSDTPAPETAPATPTPFAPAPSDLPIPSSRSARSAVIAIALIALPVAVIATRSMRSPATALPAPARIDAPPMDAATPERTSQIAPSAAEDATTLFAVESEPTHSSNRRPTARRSASDASVTVATQTATPPQPQTQTPVAAEAWIRVGFDGENVSRARVFVDGIERGWAPARVSVAIGRRRVVVRDTDGRALLDELVSVGEEHTRLSPRTLLVRATAP